MTYDQKGAGGYVATGFQMIHSIDVRHFRCFEHLQLSCSRVNVIVGDNGVGKTAVLEAIFFPLASGTDIAPRLRQYRGLEGSFSGTPSSIEDAIFADYFTNRDMSVPVSISLNADQVHNRSLEISRSGGGSLLIESGDTAQQSVSAPISFTWRNHLGEVFGPLTPAISARGVEFPTTGEDYDVSFFFAANQTVPASENAKRFSALSKRNEHRQFVEAFTKEYPWIKDIAIEEYAGAPVLFATVIDSKEKIPLPNVSGGINRIIGIALAMAYRPRCVILIDEIENGLYYKHLSSIWRLLLRFARGFECQIFATSHSEENVRALVNSTDELADISLWQAGRQREAHHIDQVTGQQVRSALNYDEEIR